jgi:hypothetical protein
MIWYNVIVEEVFVYRHVNACTYMFVYMLHTFFKLQVFPSLCWSIWRAKSVSISNISQSISLSSNNMCTTVTWYCLTSSEFMIFAPDWQTHDVCYYVLIYSIVSLDHKCIDLFNKILFCKKYSIPVHSWLFLRLFPIMISLIAGWF